jgi:histidinol-phosphate aminotransferase
MMASAFVEGTDMLNRRTFVQSLSAGAAGSLALLQTELRGEAAPLQSRTLRAPMPADSIRIGSNENAYGPSPSALDAARLACAEGHRYAGGVSSQLVDALATKHGVPTARIMLSGGSGDVLRSAIRAFTGQSLALVSGSPSYEAPVRQAQQSVVPVHEVPLTQDLKLDLGPMLAKGEGAGLVYICNPNNPTSTIVPVGQVTQLIESLAKTSPKTYVLVDEAYFEYADDPSFGTVIPLIEKYPTLVVARTFSKIHGMAGMRVGYAIAQEKTLAVMRDYHSSSGISVMSFSAALASIKDTASMKKNQSLNFDVRKFTTEAFEKAGYRVAASQANFVMVDIRRDVKGFIEACRQKSVVIGRPFPPLTNWARITVGTQQEMDRAMSVFMDLLSTAPTAVASVHPSLSQYWTC